MVQFTIGSNTHIHTYMHLLSHSFPGSGVWGRLSAYSAQADMAMSVGAPTPAEAQDCWQNSAPHSGITLSLAVNLGCFQPWRPPTVS